MNDSSVMERRPIFERMTSPLVYDHIDMVSAVQEDMARYYPSGLSCSYVADKTAIDLQLWIFLLGNKDLKAAGK